MAKSKLPIEMSLPDACLHLRVSWHKGWRLLLIGRLEGRKVAGHWLVTRASVERFVRERKKKDA